MEAGRWSDKIQPEKAGQTHCFFVLEDNANGKSNQTLLGMAGEHHRRQGVWRFWRLKDEMEKLVERQRKADQRHAGGAGDCLEGGSWMLTLEAHSIERVGWIQLRRSNAQITRNPKENRTA